MKRIPAAAMLCLLAVLAGCSKVPAGNVGVIVNLYGSEKGVETREVGTGRYWVGVNEELYLFPHLHADRNLGRQGSDQLPDR
ncbi:hypothetical protein P4119_23500 [Pseudomonas aeruginosa]|nr:hypothetical protein [Pseudomonas aeruginosa]